MSQCKIILENYSGVYYAGSEIRGRLECYFDDDIKVRCIKIRIKCKEYNEWTGTESYTDHLDDNKRKTRFITLTGNHDVLCIEQKLFGLGHGESRINRGRHVYPFTYTLPYDLPSTFKGPHGSVSYYVKAVVDRPMAFDYEDKFFFVVNSPIDFNRLSQDYQNPCTYSDEKTVCCWCCQGGHLSVDVELPKTGFVFGETIPFKVAICNLSNTNVEALTGKLVKTVKYTVDRPHVESKEDEEVIHSFREHGVGAHGEYTYNLNLVIPQNTDIPNFSKCKLFHVTYNFQVSCVMDGCTMDLDISIWDIKLGHVQRPTVDYPSTQPEPNAPPFLGGFVVPPPQPGSSLPAPPPGYQETTGKPPGYPFAPSPIDNPKASEAAASAPSAPTDLGPEMPPPSYNQVQQFNNPPYPPQ